MTLPKPALKRLQNAERRQRKDTKDRGLKAETVSVEGLWLLQRGCCVCPKCKGTVELDIESKWDEKNPPEMYPVIAHVLARGSRGGHTIDNVRLWGHSCNFEASHTEKTEIASVKRHTPIKGRSKAKAEKSRWPYRKLQSRNTFQSKKNGSANLSGTAK